MKLYRTMRWNMKPRQYRSIEYTRLTEALLCWRWRKILCKYCVQWNWNLDDKLDRVFCIAGHLFVWLQLIEMQKIGERIVYFMKLDFSTCNSTNVCGRLENALNNEQSWALLKQTVWCGVSVDIIPTISNNRTMKLVCRNIYGHGHLNFQRNEFSLSLLRISP